MGLKRKKLLVLKGNRLGANGVVCFQGVCWARRVQDGMQCCMGRTWRSMESSWSNCRASVGIRVREKSGRFC